MLLLDYQPQKSIYSIFNPHLPTRQMTDTGLLAVPLLGHLCDPFNHGVLLGQLLNAKLLLYL
jgi:hypothetical protein